MGSYVRSSLGARLGRLVPAPAGVWALDVGSIDNFNCDRFFNFRLQCDCVDYPNNCQQVNWSSYVTQAAWQLTCGLRDCTNTGYLIRGRTSGVEAYFGGLELAQIPLDCVTAVCYLKVADDQYNGERFFGFWNGSVWGGSTSIYKLAPAGFTCGERVDVFISNVQQLPITSVAPSSGDPSIPVLSVADHRLDVGYRVSVIDTANYNGNWPVIDVPSPDTVAIGGIPYSTDDTGALLPHFDYKP